jgi:hypothetical protein
MFQYCVDVLHLSEAEAYLRIAAARASRRHPVLLAMLDDGRLHLSGIAVLAPYLAHTNCEELLARATHKTKRELLVLVAEIAPKPDVSPSIRKLPKQRQKPASEHRTSGAESTLSGQSSPAPEPAPAPAPEEADKPAVVEPLAPSRYRVQFTASAELHDKLQRLAALMPGADLASMLEASVTEKLERLEAKRLGKVKNPRKSLEDADTAPGVRGISAPVRRFVWERDQAQCTFESSDGRRCPESRGLQFHHHDPYGLGGDRSADNVRLLCGPHNLYMAEMDYGKDKMEQYRRSADRVGEPKPSLPLFPERVALAVSTHPQSCARAGVWPTSDLAPTLSDARNRARATER